MSKKIMCLSARNLKALLALAGASRQKPVLPERYKFRRDAAEHLCRLGLADYRGYDGKTHGGYWLTEAGANAAVSAGNRGS